MPLFGYEQAHSHLVTWCEMYLPRFSAWQVYGKVVNSRQNPAVNSQELKYPVSVIRIKGVDRRICLSFSSMGLTLHLFSRKSVVFFCLSYFCVWWRVFLMSDVVSYWLHHSLERNTFWRSGLQNTCRGRVRALSSCGCKVSNSPSLPLLFLKCFFPIWITGLFNCLDLPLNNVFWFLSNFPNWRGSEYLLSGCLSKRWAMSIITLVSFRLSNAIFWKIMHFSKPMFKCIAGSNYFYLIDRIISSNFLLLFFF